MPQAPKSLLAVPALLAALLFVGCGGGGDSSTSAGTSEPWTKNQLTKEKIAEECAEARAEGMHLHACHIFYSKRREATE